MSYHFSPTQAEFNQKYQALLDFLKQNEDLPFSNILTKLREFPNGHILKDLFVINDAGKSFLHLAAAKEDLLLITFLKQTGHKIDLQDVNKKTPLYDACEKLKIGSVNALLGYGANPNLGDSYIMFAGVRQDGEPVSYHGENIPLVATIQSKAVVSAGQLPTITSINDLHLSKEQLAEHAAAEIVKKLIAYGVEINLQTGADHFSALHRSVTLRKPLIVKELADNHADFTLLSIDRMSALHMLVEYRSANEQQLANTQIQMQKEKEIADIVIPRSGLVYRLKAEFGNTALHTAVIGSNSYVVEALCKNDYLFPQEKLLSITNDNGNSAIHEALLEAHRGPEVLKILLRLATETDLATVNARGESVKSLAKRLKDEAESIRALVDSTKEISYDLEEFFVGKLIDGRDIIDFVKFSRFQININALGDTEHLDLNLPGVSKQLDAIRDQLYEIRLKTWISIEEAEDLNKKVERLRFKIDKRYSLDYIKTLASVTEEDLHAWVQEKLRLPNSFTGLERVADHEVALVAAHAEYNFGLDCLNAGDKAKAKTQILNSIEHYITLKEYDFLEKPYEVLATFATGTIHEIMEYEFNQGGILKNPLSNHDEQLKAHMALASLYQTLRKNAGRPLQLTISDYDLFEEESFHFSEAYKFTQGPIDPEAHVVLQREMGVSSDGTKLGTYNIQQCVAVIAHDPNTQKVVLSHFDRFSGPLKFIDQILAEFPDVNRNKKLDVYITGARDRSEVKYSQSTELSGKEIADSNIKQVLKQFKVYDHLMNIREMSVGDKLSPPAVVFDPLAVDGQRLQHRIPNRADSSLDSRALAMNIAVSNPNEYLQPLRKIDYSKNELSRKEVFSSDQLNVKYDEFWRSYGDFPANNMYYSETWKHNQLFKSLITCRNEANNRMVRRQPAQSFDHGLFQDLNHYAGLELSEPQWTNLNVANLRQQNNQPNMDLIEVLRQAPQAVVSHQEPSRNEGESLSELSEISAENSDEWNEGPPANLRQQNNQPNMDLIEVLRRASQTVISHQEPSRNEGESLSELSEASAENNDEWDEGPPAKKNRVDAAIRAKLLKLDKQGRENFSKANIILVNLDSAAADKRIQALGPTLQRGRTGIAQAKNRLMYQPANTSEQNYAHKELIKIIFSHFNSQQQQQIGLERLTEYALYQAHELGEVMAAQKLLDMRSTVIARFSPEEISEHINFFKDKFYQTSSHRQTEVFMSLLNELCAAKVVHCIAPLRRKRSLVECAGSEELMTVDEAQTATQVKEIMLLVATERRLLWQKNIRPLLDELNRGGEQWYPLLETAKNLGDDGETIEFINVRTQEKQIRKLSGKSSLDFLASLRELHNMIPQEKFRENVKSLADDLKLNESHEPFEYHENNFSGDFLLAIGLTTKTIINLINNKECVDKVNNSSSSTDLAQVECAVNIAGMSALYLTTLFQLTELIGKDFLTQESLLVKGLSVTSKVFGGINVLFLLLQDGFDIFKLVQAKGEAETALATTQLVIDGTLTVQAFVSMVAEGLIASVSGALIVPFMGLGVGLPSLINNYETLLKMALQTGRFFNTLHEQQKKGGYEWVTQTQLKDDKGNEHMVLLNETQRFMKPVDTVVITKIDFVNKRLVLKGPWIYSSMNKGNCYYVDHHKKDAFDFREGVGLSNTIALSESQLASRAWLLPLPNFYINYQYQQVPGITYRHDAELTTLRELQRNQKFISDEYCFPAWYGIYKYEIEYVPTTIEIVADEHARTFMVPTLDRTLQGLLTYEMDTRGLKSGQGIIYLNPGVSIHLYLTPYSWILNGQNLSEDTLEFTHNGLKIGDVVIKQGFDPHLGAASNQTQPLTYITKQGHGFRLDLEQKQMMLMTINYSALQASQQTLDEYLMQQKLYSPVVRVVNYHNPEDGYQGTATYVALKKRLFYTLDNFKHFNESVLISLQKEAAFFYDVETSLLWCTETHTNRLLHYYVFPGEINSVSQQGEALLINVANQFYYKINTETKKSLLIAVQSANLLSLFLKLHAFSKLSSVNVTQSKEWQKLAEELQSLIRRTLTDAKQASALYQQIKNAKVFPNLNDFSIRLKVASNEPPFIWLRKEQDHYQLISMHTHELDESALENNEYRQAHIKSGQYLGCFFDSKRPDSRILSYLVKENSNDTTGKIYLQTVNAQQMLVSFNDTPPRLLIDLLIKQAVWNDNKLVVLTADNTYQEIDASAQTSLIGFTADWVQKNPNWWQAIAVYLEKHPSKQVLISVQGIKDQQGNAIIVYYDQHAQQFIIINQAHFDAVYHGKIAKFYFFTKDNCAYQVPGMTLEQIEALFNGSQAKQSLSALDKIADYQPLSPSRIPTENDVLLLWKLPKFSLALQEFRMWLPQGVELAFDPKEGTWHVLAIKAGWFNQQENPPEAVSDLFAHVAKLFKLKANQLQTPIPIESTNFCLVENDRFVEIPGVRWPNEQFHYLGQTDQAGYYFYDAHHKTIILLSSSHRDNFEKSHSHSVKPGLAVEYAAKLNEVSVLIEIDPLQFPMQGIPLFKGCHQLVLKTMVNKGNHLISLPDNLMNHYTMIIYQAGAANPIELPGYSWFASKNQHSLTLSNGYSQLVIAYDDDRTAPNITIQVHYFHDYQMWELKENTLLIDQRISLQQTLKSIPILGYGLKRTEVSVLPDAVVGHYQKDNLAVESVAVKSGQRMPEKSPGASFLTQAAVATVSAVTSFALTTAIGLSYVFVRRFWHPASTAGIKNTVEAVSITMVANLPITEAQSMSNEDKDSIDASVERLAETTTANDFQNGFSESERLEQGFAKLTQSYSSVAAILAMEFKKRREQRFIQLDVPRKIRLKQIELSQAQHQLQTLTQAFIAGIEAKLKKTTHVNSTEWIGLIVSHLMQDYREYLNDSVSESGLTNKLDRWFKTFISSQPQEFVHDQKVLLAQSLRSLSFNVLINHLFIDKVCQIYRDKIFSENKELAENQKCAMLKIIPTLLQSEEALVAALFVSQGTDFSALAENGGDMERFELDCKSKQSLKQKYLPDVKRLFNYFKPVNSTDIEKNMKAKKAIP